MVPRRIGALQFAEAWMSVQDTIASRLKRAVTPTSLVAAAVLLAAGMALGQVLPVKEWIMPAAAPDEVAPDAWRAAFAADFSLTTTQTLVSMPQQDRLTQLGLVVIGKRLGIDLAPARVQLQKEILQRSGLFFFRNAFVGQVVYFDDENGAMALYILKRDQAAEPVANERRGAMNVATWSSGSHAFMLVGVAPDTVLADLAGKLKAQLQP